MKRRTGRFWLDRTLATNSVQLLWWVTGDSCDDEIDTTMDAASSGAITATDAPRPFKYCVTSLGQQRCVVCWKVSRFFGMGRALGGIVHEVVTCVKTEY